MPTTSKYDQIKAALFGEVNNGASCMTCPYLSLEFYLGLDGTQVCNGEALLKVVVGVFLLFLSLIDGGSVMRQALFNCQRP